MSDFFVTNLYAQTDGAAPMPGGSPILSFVPFILIFVLFYFLLVLPQQKKAKKKKEMIDTLKKGDRVSTLGGLMGTVTNLAPDVITLQVAEGVRVKVVRSYIEQVEVSSTKGGTSPEEKSEEKH